MQIIVQARTRIIMSCSGVSCPTNQHQLGQGVWSHQLHVHLGDRANFFDQQRALKGIKLMHHLTFTEDSVNQVAAGQQVEASVQDRRSTPYLHLKDGGTTNLHYFFYSVILFVYLYMNACCASPLKLRLTCNDLHSFSANFFTFCCISVRKYKFVHLSI